MPDQEAKKDNLGMSFRSSIKYWYILGNHSNRLIEAILLTTNNTHSLIRYENIPE